MSTLCANGIEIPKDSSEIATIEIKEDQLTKYKQNPDYNYNEEQNKIGWWESFKNWIFNIIAKIFDSLFGIDIAFGVLAIVFRILIYCAIGLLLFFLIKLFLKVNTRSFVSKRTNEPTVFFSEEEDIIQNENIPALIEKALINRDFRLAIRYQYLLVLKRLSEHNFVQWEQQKTNDDYLLELKNQEISKLFSSITNVYDFVWYGGFEINEDHYTQVIPTFNLITQKIGVNE
ncbi:DUF4129 domain-containing protein [Flavobacteriaceae bacterium M23B6Z8]